MGSVEEVLEKLKAKARPDQLEGMARFGIGPENRLAVEDRDTRCEDCRGHDRRAG